MQKQSQWDPLPPIVELPPAHVVFIVRANTKKELSQWEKRTGELLKMLRGRGVICDVHRNSHMNIIIGVNETITKALVEFEKSQHGHVMILPIEHTCDIQRQQLSYLVDAIVGRSAFLTTSVVEDQASGYDAIRYLNLAHEIMHTPNLSCKATLLDAMLVEFPHGCNAFGCWFLSDFDSHQLFDPYAEPGTEHLQLMRAVMEKTDKNCMVRWMQPLFYTCTDTQCNKEKKTKRPRRRAGRNVATART